ncbi:MAG TPA: sugar phosphate isomerase/epimerase family protein [Draconibacterium sp.]|nr:sugar phosphate isomerase/epimerase family protein [Draconibacterium sp.]
MKLVKIFLAAILLYFFIPSSGQKFDPPFFVFEDGLWNAKSDEAGYWSDLVKESGFDGVELIGLDKVDAMIPALKKNKLKLFTLYIQIDIDKEVPYDLRLKEYIKKYKGQITHLWVHVHSEKYSPSDQAGDAKCIEIISELADYADKYGVKIAFYPHADFWVEKVDDGVRLAKKINKPNVGTVFNLCHFLKKDEKDKIAEKLKNAMPYMFLVSINGADDGDTNNMNWDRLIQPLGRGDYDVLNVLKLLKELGYKNPVGLQCYNIKGKPEEFLKESVQTWEKYIMQLNQ